MPSPTSSALPRHYPPQKQPLLLVQYSQSANRNVCAKMSTDAYLGACGPGIGDIVTFVTVTQQTLL